MHSPEHGAVWLASCPDLREEQIDASAKQAAASGLPSPSRAVSGGGGAWGTQLTVESAGYPHLHAGPEVTPSGPQTQEFAAGPAGTQG